MKLRRFLSCMMALLLVCSLPLSAFAAEYDLAQGSVIVNATESGQTVTHGTNAPVEDSAPVITQSTAITTNTITINAAENATANVTIQNVNIANSDPTDAPPVDHSGQAAVTIDVADNASANVTLEKVNINVGGTGGDNYENGEAAVQVTGNGNVTLELDGENTVQSGKYRAGVEKNTTDSSGKGNLTITDENGTAGSLNAAGGIQGAGIGGAKTKDASNITIAGSAEVTATGGAGSSGIGGGNLGSGSDITISGSAKVTANGGQSGSGIGGGFNGSGSDIIITENAKVTATGGKNGAGIGGGFNSSIGGFNGSGSDITIRGSAEVTAKGGQSGSGIGGGVDGSGSNITVSENAQVKAQGGKDYSNSLGTIYGAGAAIGGGGKYKDSNPNGTEATPNTNALNEGWIATYTPTTTDLDTVPDSLTYRDNGGTVQTATTDITREAPQSATSTAHGHEAGFKVGDKLVAVTTHNYSSYESDNNATCTHDGTESAKCTVPGCTAKLERTIPGSMKQHSFTNYISNNDATYDADGTKTAVCDHCDATDTIPDPGSKLVREETAQTAPLYRVIGQDGKAISCKAEQKGGVLTITVDADFATLTGSTSGLKTLKAQGIDTIVFVTNGATSTFALADLLASMTAVDSYSLTHDGDKVTFTLSSGEDIGKILK